jgi:putative MFS transporter
MASIPASGGVNAQQVAARLERLPYCSWHTKMRLIIGTAWFFDAFDSLAIAYVLPALIGLWKLNPGQIGTLIAIGFAGQLIGSLAAGWVAERIGRVPTLMITLLIFTVMSFACAFAWNYETMLWFRFIQGLGLGGEVPIMAAYVNEFAKAERRGRFSLGLQVLFTIGIICAAAVSVWVVPNFGWQWMFIIGAVPALLVLPMRTVLPESPRWLASRGRYDEADKSLKRIEDVAVREGKPLPPLPADLPAVVATQPKLADLFKGIYLKRTLALWGIWICAYFNTYGLTAWAPSLFRTVFKLPVQESLTYGFILNAVALVGATACIFLIDRIGRKRLFTWGLVLGSLPLLTFLFGGERGAPMVLAMISLSFLFVSLLAIGLATFTAESYPNHMRALGGGVAGGWQRGASMVGPLVVGAILPAWGLNSVFVVFGIVALVGAVICASFATETRGQPLEKVSPPP